MVNKTHSEFQVKLEGIKLPESLEKRIEKGIQSVVLQELAGYTPNPEGPDDPGFPYHPRHGGVIVIPIKWPGYWVRILNEKELQGLGNVINIKDAGR